MSHSWGEIQGIQLALVQAKEVTSQGVLTQWRWGYCLPRLLKIHVPRGSSVINSREEWQDADAIEGADPVYSRDVIFGHFNYIRIKA